MSCLEIREDFLVGGYERWDVLVWPRCMQHSHLVFLAWLLASLVIMVPYSKVEAEMNQTLLAFSRHVQGLRSGFPASVDTHYLLAT